MDARYEALKLDKLLGVLGYGSRREVQGWIRAGRVTDVDGVRLSADSAVPHDRVRLDGEPLDPPAPLVIALHKPVGFTCSTSDPGATVYELLPARFLRRRPVISPVGRLDKDTSGLLLLTDDGDLLHRLIHPRHGAAKVYEVTLDRPLDGTEVERFAAGDLMLRGETEPLRPAGMEVTGPRSARLTLHEGRYHQVRRMFAAVGNHVLGLHRRAVGGLWLPTDLAEGTWRALTEPERALLQGEPRA